MNKDSKIYIAGHKGLVGSAIWKCLAGKGYERLIGASFEQLDLRDPAAVRWFFEQEKPEYVILAAARVGGIVANNTYRADFIYDNLMIQNNVIHQSFLSGVKKLLFLGSTCIYPGDCRQPMKEEYLLTSALEYTSEPYAIAKIAGIKLCESYNIQHGTNFLAVMPTNLYGPNDNFDLEKSHVLPALIRKIHLGKCIERNDWAAVRIDLDKRPVNNLDGHASDDDIRSVLHFHGIGGQPAESGFAAQVRVEVWGSGKPLREFLWSDDMAEACVFVMERVNFADLTSGRTEIRNTHLNIGTGIEISVHDLAMLISEVVGFGGELYFNHEKPDGTMRKLTDPTNINRMGWKHSVSLQDGIRRLYGWYLEEKL